MTDAEVVWKGPEALRPFLVAIDSLEQFPDNPRIGDPEAVAGSLARFGQQKNVVVDGSRIVAGHHVVLGAKLNGWTHVVAFPNDFSDEEEARAFLIADNRTADLGRYDLERLAELRARLDAPPPRPPAPPTPPGEVREVVLIFGADQHVQFEEMVRRVAREKGTSGPSETTLAAYEIAVDALDG